MASAPLLTRIDRVPKKTHKKFTEAWNAGATRQQLADEFHLTVKGVDSLRTRLKLPPRVKLPPLPAEDVGRVEDKRQIEVPFDPVAAAKRARLLAGNSPLPPFHPIALDVFLEAQKREWPTEE